MDILGLCPNAEWYYERVVTLPIYPKMTKNEINKVVGSFRKIILKARAKNPKAEKVLVNR